MPSEEQNERDVKAAVKQATFIWKVVAGVFVALSATGASITSITQMNNVSAIERGNKDNTEKLIAAENRMTIIEQKVEATREKTSRVEDMNNRLIRIEVKLDSFLEGGCGPAGEPFNLNVRKENRP